MPQFELAGAVTADQRQNTAVRRKIPRGNTETGSLEVAGDVVEKAVPADSRKEQIIREMAARHIQGLLRADNQD